ncbi:hypothetical protein VP496E541_P0136 [Vibrio phage 496E54-1]|nr:hypothetical protein VP495E541_P0135 [Vibrio phage 495E54-1]CAH9013890.1 hypothetical protein VP496E541_P0136 [Vibrio phage 496E54-1]
MHTTLKRCAIIRALLKPISSQEDKQYNIPYKG